MPDTPRPFQPVRSEFMKRRMQKARRTNERRDHIDNTAGFAAPDQCRLDVQLRTVMSAIAAGLDTLAGIPAEADISQMIDCFCEGLAMLEAVELTVRGPGRATPNA